MILITFLFIQKAKEFKKIKITRYEESLYYANVDNFKSKMIKSISIDPDTVLINIDNKYIEELKKIRKSQKV